MSSFKDFYDILKDLINVAKKAKNQAIVTQALDLQEKFFELREENDTLNNKIKELNDKIAILEKAKITEKEIEYSEKGFLTLKKDEVKIPYCSLCWKKEHQLIPLSQYNAWFQYKCGNCKTDVVVMDSKGNPINDKKKGEK